MNDEAKHLKEIDAGLGCICGTLVIGLGVIAYILYNILEVLKEFKK